MNVNLWFARDGDNEIVSILNSTNENEYHCPICASKVIPKALESKRVTPHFAHKDVSKCNSESMLHWWFKHKFIEKGEVFSIKTDKVISFVCKDFKVENTYELENGIYRPDLVVETECGNEIVFEMANTNKKQVKDYIDKWIELDKIVVEVDIKALQNADEMKLFNALYYQGKCFNFNKRDGGYYNTIGKLKEEMKTNGKYDIELVKKLDWFWKEISKDTLNEEFYLTLETLLNKNNVKLLIIDILKPNKHSHIINDFNNHKICRLLDLLKLTNDNESYEIVIDKAKGSKRDVFVNKVTLQVGFYSSLIEKDIAIDDLNEENVAGYRKYFQKAIENNKIESFISNFNKKLNNYPLHEGIRLYCAYESIYIYKVGKRKQLELKTLIKDCELTDEFWLDKVKDFKRLYKMDLNLMKVNEELKKIELSINEPFKDNFISFDSKIDNDKVLIGYKYILNEGSNLYEYLKEYLFMSIELNDSEFSLDVSEAIKSKLKIKEFIEKMNDYKNHWRVDEYYDVNLIVEDVLNDISEKWMDIKIFDKVYDTAYQAIDLNIHHIFNSKTTYLISIGIDKILTYSGLHEDTVNEIHYLIDDLSGILHNLIVNIIEQNKFEFYCYDCDTNFIMNSSEIFYFLNKNFNIPKRCKSCRQERKQNK